MSIGNDFISIVNEYDNKLYDIFKKIIENTALYAKENNMNSIETYIIITEKLETSYVDLALAMGIISPYDVPNEINPPITERLLERVYELMEPFIQDARDEIKLQAEDVLNSKTLDELKEKYEKLSHILNTPLIAESQFLFSDLDLDNKKVKWLKYF